MRLSRAAALCALALAASRAAAQPADTTRLVLRADLGRDTISRHIYGQFAEHLGRDIYDGVWTRAGGTAGGAAIGAGTPWHLRDDVVEALRRLQVPNVRWPGGCFADYYHWRDGIGAPARRPRMVNTVWGGAVEDNSFGTHEYMALVRRLGAEPFVVGNVGTGAPREMAEWWEYVNHPGGSTLADERTANGDAAPFDVRRWGVGNESWGCGGSMSPAHYADLYRQYATFLRPFGDRTRPFRIATGPSGDDYAWTDTLMRRAGEMMDGIDLHYYTLAGTWAHKGSATRFDARDWFRSMQRALQVEPIIARHSAIMDRYDPRKRVALIVGEWGTWYDPDPADSGGVLYQQNTLRDALVAAAELDVFNRHADRVRGANVAQMVNVLQAMILTRGPRLVLTPTYHVFALYTVHHDALLLPLEVRHAAWYAEGADSIPAVSASASRDRAGTVHVTLGNLDPARAHPVEIAVQGAAAGAVTGEILTASSMDARNTFERPDAVRPAPFAGARAGGGRVTLVLPPRSLVVLTLR